mmetsp:Transcript_109966/g.218418  ORF Transcript_109966/g.218418 Transcript_109966/m.218418 type:complete len:214 (-) Transcript_109966:429-1070(-)
MWRRCARQVRLPTGQRRQAPAQLCVPISRCLRHKQQGESRLAACCHSAIFCGHLCLLVAALQDSGPQRDVPSWFLFPHHWKPEEGRVPLPPARSFACMMTRCQRLLLGPQPESSTHVSVPGRNNSLSLWNQRLVRCQVQRLVTGCRWRMHLQSVFRQPWSPHPKSSQAGHLGCLRCWNWGSKPDVAVAEQDSNSCSRPVETGPTIVAQRTWHG